MKKLYSKLLLALLLISMPAFGMVMNLQKILTAQSMAASFSSSAIDASLVDLVSIQAVWAGGGAPNGTFSVEVSNDDLSPPTNWSAYPGSAVVIAADGDLAYNVANYGFKWIRLRYVRTGGTGTLNASLVSKMEGTAR